MRRQRGSRNGEQGRQIVRKELEECEEEEVEKE